MVAGPTDPGLRVAAPAPIAISWDAIAATWAGQDGLDLNGPGDVHVVLTGLPAARAIVSAALTDPAGGSWIYRADGGPIGAIDPYALPLAVRRGGDATRADLAFAPIRNESGSDLSLRLVLDDGTILVTRFAGGFSDPGLRAAGIAPTSVVARPGDDLNDLARRYGTVRLTSGTYLLDRPLVLDNPVSILAQPGVTLLFSQAPDAPTWSTAIKIHSGHTTLDGFAVRFAGPIRWTAGVSYGAAVIGTTDNFDTGANPLKVDIVLTRLDLESPPASSALGGSPAPDPPGLGADGPDRRQHPEGGDRRVPPRALGDHGQPPSRHGPRHVRVRRLRGPRDPRPAAGEQPRRARRRLRQDLAVPGPDRQRVRRRDPRQHGHRHRRPRRRYRREPQRPRDHPDRGLQPALRGEARGDLPRRPGRADPHAPGLAGPGRRRGLDPGAGRRRGSGVGSSRS